MSTATITADQTALLSEVQSFVHDLRNPLAAIHGSAEILVRSSLSQPQVHRLARNMYSASIRMTELLQQCLDQSQCRDRKFELIDLRDVVTSAVERVAASSGLDEGGIENMVDDRDGRPKFYDLNAMSNFVTKPLEVLGWDPHERLVDWLVQLIAAQQKAAA